MLCFKTIFYSSKHCHMLKEHGKQHNTLNFFYFIIILIAILFSNYQYALAQLLQPNRMVDWKIAGVSDSNTTNFTIIDMQNFGAIGNGVNANDDILNLVFSSYPNQGLILYFAAGDYLFNESIDLPSNVLIKGQGAELTQFIMSLNGSGNAINIVGTATNDTSSFLVSATKDKKMISISNPQIFQPGDWVQVIQNDSIYITSGWAYHTIGQIMKIKSVTAHTIEFYSAFRMDYEISKKPYLKKINPKENCGIECLKIKRIDNTSPQQSSIINMTYAVNCWIQGIESENCTFSHIKAALSSNITISGSYIHHAFSYDEGGRGYGVLLESATGEVRVENNIFNHLRHSMIVQSGANGNVFAYNFSHDPNWTSFPSNAAGDIVLHGNYPYCNLFEQNICQNIVIDDSHGANGPFNTFLRNRALGFGLFFSSTSSPNQNIIGNEITNTSSPYCFVNYRILGSGHYLYGNNNKGTINPSGTQNLVDITYAYTLRPAFVLSNQFGKIGPPNTLNTAQVPSADRWNLSNIFSGVCGKTSILNVGNPMNLNCQFLIYPNPANQFIEIKSANNEQIIICNSIGQVNYNLILKSGLNRIEVSDWEDGIYFIYWKNGQKKIIIMH